LGLMWGIFATPKSASLHYSQVGQTESPCQKGDPPSASTYSLMPLCLSLPWQTYLIILWSLGSSGIWLTCKIN